jgi:superfamily II DNA or RNA helicase
VTFTIGSLVKARDREWVVLPESTDDLLILRPLGGTDEEVTGIVVPLERVESASFAPPDPSRPGDYRSGRLLRDAVRLASRNTAGPFRSFGNIAVEPRSYQLVPLLMALKLDPVRLLIADDVGIGKTVEALLVARELLDRGDARRLAVLCPPHLAGQWQEELRDKFHLDARLVLPSTVNRLEKQCRFAESVFDRFPFTVVSTDFIKQDSRRHEFLQAAPELVIVDEAHTCVEAAGHGHTGAHKRYQLVRALAERPASPRARAGARPGAGSGQAGGGDEASPGRHMIFVTATPHSGKKEAFRALLGLLRPSFAQLPEDLSGEARRDDRRSIAQHFVQRRRADIRHFLGDETPFPKRLEREESYALSPEYKALFDQAIAYARDTWEKGAGEDERRKRVRWWSLLALLASLSSSPAAAADTLRTRAAGADTETAEEADAVGRRTIMDLMDDAATEGIDVIPGGDFTADDDIGRGERAKLLEMARRADALKSPAADAKLARVTELVDDLLQKGHRPIVFCRFIPTADYVAEGLRQALSRRRGLKDLQVESVTGLLPPAEREERIRSLAGQETEHRVLVATDCLSEGINLQSHFDAVVHYDLSWNPTRHEQREGRVDRYGQPRSEIRVITYFGKDNPLDGIVLETLVRKQRKISDDTGVTVPVPDEGASVMDAIFEGLLLREKTGDQEVIPGIQRYLKPKAEELDRQWRDAAEREKRSRTMFAQEGIKADEVQRELDEERAAVGSSADVRGFVCAALTMNGAVVDERAGGAVRLDLGALPQALQDAIRAEGAGPAGGAAGKLRARFEMPVADGEVYLSRTHPLVSGLAGYVMDAALDPVLQDGDGHPVARRCGAVRTGQVATRTTVLLTRLRYKVVTKRRGEEPLEQLAEECLVLGFEGAPDDARWLESGQLEPLLAVTPDANVSPEQASGFVSRVVDGLEGLRAHLDEVAHERCEALADAHRRVREAARQRGVSYEVLPQGAPDVLGVYVYLPVPGGAAGGGAPGQVAGGAAPAGPAAGVPR